MNVSRLMGGRWGVVCSLLLVAVLCGGCHSSPPDKQFAEVPAGMTPATPAAKPSDPATPVKPTAPDQQAQPAATTPSAPASTKGSTGGPAMDSAIIPVANAQAPAVPMPKPYIPGLLGGTNDNGLDILKVQDEVHVTFSDLPLPLQPIDDQVKQDGTITLLFNHTFNVAGKTRREVEKEIHDYYVPDYYRNMTITVRVLPATQFYYVNGEVKAPNRQIYIGPITVMQAIASAGGFTDFAKKRGVVLTRANGRKITVNCVKALKDHKLDPLVYPGDSIYVPRTWM